MIQLIKDFFASFRWYRKWRGGEWCMNRYWAESGTVLFFVWERKDLGSEGGNMTTIKKEEY